MGCPYVIIASALMFRNTRPQPQVVNTALDTKGASEEPFHLPCSPSGPFVGLAFKLEEGRWAGVV